MRTLDFLQSVLPAQGQYCWVTIKNKKAKQGFVPTVEELAVRLLEEDAKGVDVYFACASYLQPTKRTSDNARFVKALWLDIDAGPGKPYENADIALEELDDFCRKACLPFATVICSGNGIHAWWPLGEPLEPKEWKRYAERLKALCVTFGFDADPARTADIASILRAPGTRNFKNPQEPKNVSTFEFDAGDNAGENGYILTSLIGSGIDIVKDWEKLKPKTEEISFTKGYPDGERTNALVERAGFLFGPARNATLEEGIEALTKWNLHNTPVLPEDKILCTARSIFKRESAKRLHENRPVVYGLPMLPAGYRWDTAGRMTTEVPIKNADGDEHLETVALTEFPLYLYAITRKEREFKQSHIFKMKLPHEDEREFQVLCSDFEGSNFMAAMAEHIASGCIKKPKLFKNYVDAHASDLRRKAMDAIRYQQFGWKENDTAFLIGDTLIKSGGKMERVYGGEETAHRMKQMEPRKGGSLHAWATEANLLFSDQYIHLGYALVASFATPLLKFCMGESDGGFVLSITSPGSGKGKTRTIEAATSVWGELESLQITPRDTLNAQFAIVTAAGNLPVFMDEWNEKDSAVQAKFLRQLTVGHDKNRSQRDGTVKAKAANYKTLLITTANHSIYQIMNTINDEAAAARVVEIVAPDLEGETFKKFDLITRRMLTNSGFAGREFIYQLMKPGVIEQVKVDLQTTIEKIRDFLHTEGKHRYITVLPAAILVAAKLLVQHGILEFDVERLIRWSFEHVQNRIQSSPILDAEETLSEFLNENQGKILAVSGASVGGKPVMILNNNGNIPQQIVGRAERDTNRLYLIPNSFKEWCKRKNYYDEKVINELEVKGILKDRRKQITLSGGTPARTGRTLCWEFYMPPEDFFIQAGQAQQSLQSQES